MQTLSDSSTLAKNDVYFTINYCSVFNEHQDKNFMIRELKPMRYQIEE